MIEYTGDNSVFPKDADTIFGAIGSGDKTRHWVHGNHHGRPIADGALNGQTEAGNTTSAAIAPNDTCRRIITSTSQHIPLGASGLRKSCRNGRQLSRPAGLLFHPICVMKSSSRSTFVIRESAFRHSRATGARPSVPIRYHLNLAGANGNSAVSRFGSRVKRWPARPSSSLKIVAYCRNL